MAIGYTPQTWVNGSAPALSAANLQTMDNGINAACDALDAMGATATPTASKVPIADAYAKLDGWITDATETAKGKVQLAANDGTTASTAVQATDSRLAQATESHRGTAELATAAEIVTGTDTGRVPNVANLKTALDSDGMWLTKRTKMPDEATAVYSQDAWSSVGSWIDVNGGLSLSASGGALVISCATAGSTRVIGNADITKALIYGKTILIRAKINTGTCVFKYPTAGTYTVGTVGTKYAVIVCQYQEEATPAIRINLGNLPSSSTVTIDWIWIGDLDATTKQLYTVGTLSEEAARIADQLGDSAGVGVAASGTITSNLTNVSNADTVTVAGKVYTFKTALTPTEGEVLIGGDYQASLVNLARAINHTGTPDTDYKCAAAHPLVSAANTSAAVTTITALTTGELGNSITLAKSAATLTLSGTTLSGGYSDAAAKIITAVGNNIAGSGTRPAAAKIDITSTSLIGYEQAVDVASGGTTTLPAGGTWVWFVYGHGATISSAKRGSSAGGTTLTVAGANATVWYRRYA